MNEGRGFSSRLVRLREFRAMHTKMTSTFVHKLAKNQQLTQVKGQHLLWVFNSLFIWCYELTENMIKLINFTHFKCENQFLRRKYKQ